MHILAQLLVALVGKERVEAELLAANFIPIQICEFLALENHDVEKHVFSEAYIL